MGLLKLLVHFSFVLGDQVEWQSGGNHDVRSSGQFKNLSVIEHFVISNWSWSLIWLLLSLKIILVFRNFFIIFSLFVFTGIRVDLVNSLLLIREESRSDETVVLEIWIHVCFCYFLGKLDVVVLSQVILLLSLFNSMSKYVILTRAFIRNSNRDIDFLRKRIKILEWVLRPLGTDEFF